MMHVCITVGNGLKLIMAVHLSVLTMSSYKENGPSSTAMWDRSSKQLFLGHQNTYA